MQTATQNLENDHEYILRLIQVMNTMAVKGSGDTNHIGTVISIIKNFADGFHHAKEENLLFPAMIEKGFSKEQGPLAVMLHDHVLGRNFVAGMENGLRGLQTGNSEALAIIYENMIGYGKLLEGHIAKENNVLFRMADKVLSADEQNKLLHEFRNIEESAEYKLKIQEYQEAINNLHMFYN